MWNERKKNRLEPFALTTVCTLADLRAGESARVDCVDCVQVARCERLMAYGLVRGQTITLVQSQPAFVIRVDETELALDEEIARCVHVFRA